ncbi:MAG: alpha/beta hydrolase [Gemmatimonadota bacterium]
MPLFVPAQSPLDFPIADRNAAARAGRRIAAVAALTLLSSAAGPASAPGLALVQDTTRVRAAYDRGKALFDDYERGHGHVAVVNGIRMHYLAWGAPSGVPLVWAHGSAGSGYEIRHLAPRLVAAGYRVIAPDYRGHGQTKVTDYEFGLDDIADDFVALLDKLGIRRAVFGGSSKGGFVAAAVYHLYPDRVSGLLMHDGGTWSNQWAFDHDSGYAASQRKMMASPDAGPPRVTGESQYAVFRGLVGDAIASGHDVTPERAVDLLCCISPMTEGGWAFIDGFEKLMGTPANYIIGMTAPSRLPMLQWSQHALIPMEVFRRLRVPMMIIDPVKLPDDDPPVSDQNARLAAKFPNLVIHKIYPETGHAAFQERPDWFIRDATELLARVRRGRGRGTGIRN